MHPHNNCSVCHGNNEPAGTKLSQDEQVMALLSSMRQGAQDTLAALQKRGFEITKKTD